MINQLDKKRLIFIYAKSQKRELLRYLKKSALYKNGKVLVVTLGEDIDIESFNKPNVIYKTYLDYINCDEKFGDFEVINWINTWSDFKLNSFTLKEIISYDNISLYWIAIAPHITSEYRKLCRKINIIEMITKIETPDEILLLGAMDDWKKVIITICKFRNIKYQYSQPPFLFINIINPKTKLSLACFYFRIRDFVRNYLAKFFYIFKNKKVKIKSEKKIIFISQPSTWRNIYDSLLDRERKADEILDNIVNLLIKEKNKILGLDVNYSRGGIRVLLEKLFLEKNFLWLPIEFYYSKKINQLSKKISKSTITRWNNLLKNNNFQNSINYRGIPLFDLIKENMFFNLVPFNIFNAVRYIETMKSIIKLEKPDLIILVYEAGPCGRAVIIAANLMNNIPTLAIQHGIIHQFHDDYILFKTSNGSNGSFLDCPIPKKTAVYGDFSKNTLMQNSKYPDHSIVITGQPRYDTLINMMSIPDIRHSILNRLRIGPNKKVILIATGSAEKVMGQIGGQLPMIKAVLTSISRLDDIYVIIKLHPLEKETRTIYRNIVKDMGLLKKVRIIEEINIFELITACDLFITQNSTSAYEALIAKKQVLIVNINSAQDYIPFIKDNVAIGAYKTEDVKEAILGLLYNPALKDKLSKNRENFIYKHCYKSDGLATKRVLDLIYTIIKK